MLPLSILLIITLKLKNKNLHSKEIKLSYIAYINIKKSYKYMQVGSYSYETNAFKFGNQPFSYSMLQVPSQHLWHRNFNIQFGFRTFYPDGFLFVAPVGLIY